MQDMKRSRTVSQAQKFEYQSKWECKSILDNLGELESIHVHPLMGENHVMSGRCWCYPSCSFEVNVPIWSHNLKM